MCAPALAMTIDPQIRLDQAAARSGELDLVRACMAGDVQALARFELEYAGCLRAGVARVCAEPSFVEELSAALLARLFSGSVPKLAAYSGRGPLSAWLRIVAARAALDQRRSERRRRVREQNALVASQPALPEPERGLDRARYASAFATAMRSALRRLTPRQRALLLMRYREGLELTEISERFSVHRATVQRWLALAASELREGLSAELSQCGVRLSQSDLNGLAPQLISALGPAVASWLGAAAPGLGSAERRSTVASWLDAVVPERCSDERQS